jgi:hypothetical protein
LNLAGLKLRRTAECLINKDKTLKIYYAGWWIFLNPNYAGWWIFLNPNYAGWWIFLNPMNHSKGMS